MGLISVWDGISWFFLSCGGKLGVALELQWGSQGTSTVAKRQSSLLSSFEGKLGIALESLQWNPASSQVEGRSCGFLSWGGKLGVPLEL